MKIVWMRLFIHRHRLVIMAAHARRHLCQPLLYDENAYLLASKTFLLIGNMSASRMT